MAWRRRVHVVWMHVIRVWMRTWWGASRARMSHMVTRRRPTTRRRQPSRRRRRSGCRSWLGRWLLGSVWHPSLPCFVRNTHGKICSSLILNLSPLVDEGLRSGVVETVHTFTFSSTDHSSLEAFAILLQTLRLLATASHVVTTMIRSSLQGLRSNTRLEGIRILGTGVLNGLVTKHTSIGSVATVRTVAPITESFCRKTLAVQFETLRPFAVARTPLAWRLLFRVLLSGRSRSLA
mmetsp:Transcript_116859/g.174480  ORF Transcript_116859/g.174480 Transcript_116859/m.174480 type:complete len:235 (+) Transcript_116859:636-1340(+)